MIFELLLGFFIAIVIAVVAWWRKALDAGGAVAACVVGTVIFGLGGLGPSIALAAFFLSGSILSAMPNPRSAAIEMEAEGRTWKQVVANGLIPMLAIIGGQLDPGRESTFLLAYYGSLAASCSDSWGTEIGIRFGKAVHDSMTGKRVEPGLSGALSIAGTIASVAGSALIMLAAAIPITVITAAHAAPALVGILIAGILGSLGDSVLGSSVQAKYRIGSSGRILETPKTTQDSPEAVSLASGYGQINNNRVNFLSSALGALFSIIILNFSATF